MRYILPLALLLATACSQPYAANTPYGDHPYAAPYYAATLLPPTLLPTPAAVGSSQFNRELAVIEHTQAAASEEEKAAAAREATPKPDLLTASISPALTREDYPLTYHLLDRADSTCEGVVEQDKKFWHRPRPFTQDTRIESLVPKLSNASYPSGHTTCGGVSGLVLADLIPAAHPQLSARVAEIAHHRIVAGVHYPQDLYGGEMLSYLVLGALEQTSDYQLDRDAAREELTAKPLPINLAQPQ